MSEGGERVTRATIKAIIPFPRSIYKKLIH